MNRTNARSWRAVMALVWVAGCVSAHEDGTPSLSDDGADNPADSNLAANRARVAGASACIDDGGVTPLLEPKVVQLWPPNHQFHDIAISDCVDITAACGDSVRAEFTWASSDEPVDDLGDGHFAPDIQLSDDCEHLAVRAERQGPKNGRVYKLGVRVIDSAGGITDSVCSVIVDHDQRGVVGEDSGEAYRIKFDGTQGTPTCDGTQPPPPTNPPPPPPTNPPPPGEAPL